jgi:hypothetical protein
MLVVVWSDAAPCAVAHPRGPNVGRKYLQNGNFMPEIVPAAQINRFESLTR